MPNPARRSARPHSPSTTVKRALTRPKAAPPKSKGGVGPSAAALIHELGSCVTEADLVQVLYHGLHARFGYDVINLHVLEREGWLRSLPIDSGVLQDVRRRPLRESMFARQYANPRTAVLTGLSKTQLLVCKGPGPGRDTKTAVWVPVEHQGELIGSVIYQSYRKRRVPATETAFLEEVHKRLGVLVKNASLNELTRNQARRLEALNSVARAMASTLDETSVLTGLHTTLRELLPVDALEMVAMPDDDSDRLRLLHVEADSAVKARSLPARSPAAAAARAVMRDSKPVLVYQPTSSLWVAIKEGGVTRGALGISCARAYAYEDSTAAFLELVSDEVTLALRNARSYEAIEDQRRRLEVVNSIGRRLASSLDRWSIMRTLREELGTFLDFDGFIIATITQSAEGPVAEGYQYVAGVEEVVPPVAIAVTGPSREAYETGRPVLFRHSPWARSFERKGLERERWNVGRGAAVFVSGAPGKHRDVSRSFVWVPVLSGDTITAMLSLQSYHDSAFDEWHVRLLQDVAAHVSLALANADHFAQAQSERARLEALHVLEMGVAGASDESQIADAVLAAVTDYTDAAHMVLAYLDAAGNVVGFNGDRGGSAIPFGPTPIEDEPSFRRLIEGGGSVFESLPEGAE